MIPPGGGFRFGAGTTACVRELFSGSTVMATGSVGWSVPPHDLAVLRVVPGASSC